MIEHVSTFSILGMVFSLLIAVCLPVAALIAAMKKWKGRTNISGFFIGGATFVLFALLLEQLLHFVVLKATGTLLTGNLWLYALYGGLAAGLFEETGRFLAMKFCMKKTLSSENAVVYGIGHGGTEAILLVGLTYISNLATVFLINTDTLLPALQAYDETTRQTVLQSLSALWTTPGWQFWLAGIERISAILLHIILSYIVYLAVKERKVAFYLLAILIHAVVDAGVVLLTSFIPVPLMEALLLAAVLLLGFFVHRYARLKSDLRE